MQVFLEVENAFLEAHINWGVFESGSLVVTIGDIDTDGSVLLDTVVFVVIFFGLGVVVTVVFTRRGNYDSGESESSESVEEYRDAVCKGEKKIYSKFAHELLCSLREFEAREKAKYEARKNECVIEKDVYVEKDEAYVTVIGRGYEEGGKKYDFSYDGKPHY